MDKDDMISLLTKTLLGIATCAISDDADELTTDLVAIKFEAKRALEICGYDFELLMRPDLGVTKNAEA